MSISRKLAVAIATLFAFSLLAATPAAASSSDEDKQGDIKVCKVLKDVKDLKDKVTFNFVIREKKSEGEKDKYKFDIKFSKGEQDKVKCEKYTVDAGEYVVREKCIPKGYKLHAIDVKGKGCYYKDQNDKDAKVQVDLKSKGKCTVTFTNKEDKK